MTDNEKAMLKTIRKYESLLTKYKSLLVDILDCGYEDLALLPDTTDCHEIIENLKENGIWPNLCDILGAMANKGQDALQAALEKAKETATDEEKEEIEKLDPYEDFVLEFNCLASDLYLNHGETYNKYVPDTLEMIEDKIGLGITLE